ncbi:hypothetical protein N7532_000421 [Penicillium argentinense]|uniref:Uncharacterized protein n=1 Tax=Penicillium argentinense TaxID=1131581 RepID=A0A9W9G594_9EURO|nr:uncharacterized protein N7532_000421 [Penicillium argentinense]KAJ5112376.1 hypothetical protein N7532_000421 [Penicillium argentinense]
MTKRIYLDPINFTFPVSDLVLLNLTAVGTGAFTPSQTLEALLLNPGESYRFNNSPSTLIKRAGDHEFTSYNSTGCALEGVMASVEGFGCELVAELVQLWGVWVASLGNFVGSVG